MDEYVVGFSNDQRVIDWLNANVKDWGVDDVSDGGEHLFISFTNGEDSKRAATALNTVAA